MARQTRHRPVIKQILPAEGWSAVYALDKPDKLGRYYCTEPLALWALVEEGGFVYPAGIAGADIVDCWRTWESPSLIDYVRTEDLHLLAEELNERAQAWVRLEAAT